jgi:hypothetical protein
LAYKKALEFKKFKLNQLKINHKLKW